MESSEFHFLSCLRFLSFFDFILQFWACLSENVPRCPVTRGAVERPPSVPSLGRWRFSFWSVPPHPLRPAAGASPAVGPWRRYPLVTAGRVPSAAVSSSSTLAQAACVSASVWVGSEAFHQSNARVAVQHCFLWSFGMNPMKITRTCQIFQCNMKHLPIFPQRPTQRYFSKLFWPLNFQPTPEAASCMNVLLFLLGHSCVSAWTVHPTLFSTSSLFLPCAPLVVWRKEIGRGMPPICRVFDHRFI